LRNKLIEVRTEVPQTPKERVWTADEIYPLITNERTV